MRQAAVLGVPALYVANTGRGYTNEQESRYGLVKNIFQLDWEPINSAIDSVMHMNKEEINNKKNYLLNDTIDVSQFIVECVENWPAFMTNYQQTQGT